ncbi:MAG TPA: glycosyltransferase family 39 protein [Alphaproteobacteria bacterium]|nr:glycosyltransferase family 39 protein [Alphaproteobacteria bacterium]
MNGGSNGSKVLALQLAVVVGVCAFFFFFGLGAFGLVGADEPRYAQISREMFARHDWIVPTLNGSPWLEKPAFLYWKIMNSYRVFGVHDWAARIPSAAHATTLILVMFFFMRRFRPGAELDAALITASSVGIFAFARGASTDMVLSAPFCMAMLAWWAWHQSSRKLWLAAFYALLAVGALAKGPVAPGLAVLIVGAFAAVRRDLRILWRSAWWPGFLLFFAITLPWYLAVQSKVPQFFRIFFIEHNLERFGTNLYQHVQPFWYYIPVFVLGMMPWSVFCLPALVESVQSMVRSWRSRNGEDQNDGLSAFFAVWVLVPIVFFSISRSKLPGYILPSLPAAALLTADYLYRSAKAFSPLKRTLHSLVCGALVAASLIAPWRLMKQSLPESAEGWIVTAAMATALMVLLALRRAGRHMLRFATLVPLVLGLAFLLRPAAHVIDDAASARPLSLKLQELGPQAGSVVVFDVKREVEYGLNFYRNQAIARYERDGVPESSHLVVAKAGSEAAVRTMVGSRAVIKLGSFPPQRLEFFLVSAAK